MKTYARVVNGLVIEMCHDSDDFTIDQLYPSEIVAQLVDVTNVTPTPGQNWGYDGTGFHLPAAPERSPEEVRATNTSTRDVLLAQAATAIAPLQDAVDLDMATDAEGALLKLWKQYRVAVNRVDLSQATPTWPEQPAA